jgi:formylglycine-generating enzyme required for sulfatase activity
MRLLSLMVPFQMISNCQPTVNLSLALIKWWKQLREYPDHPVVLISWKDIESYADWLTKVIGRYSPSFGRLSRS